MNRKKEGSMTDQPGATFQVLDGGRAAAQDPVAESREPASDQLVNGERIALAPNEPPTGADAALAGEEVKEAGPYPFLKTPAVHNGVIIAVNNDTAEVPLNQEDIDAAHEELYTVSEAHAEEETKQAELRKQEARDMAQLKGTRENLRKSEEKLLKLGGELAQYGREIHNKTRRVESKVVLTLTAQNEVITTCARSGAELGRRTASAEEIERASKGSQHVMKLEPGGDSTSARGNPDDEMVIISVSCKGYTAAKKRLRDNLNEVVDPKNPDELFKIATWQVENPGGPSEKGRSYVEVPRYIARAMSTIAEGSAVDLRVEPSKFVSGASLTAESDDDEAGDISDEQE